MNFRIKEVLKAKKIVLKDLAEKLGMSYQSLNYIMNKPTLKTLGKITAATDIYLMEFLEAPEGYDHFYDSVSGEWLGIRKK